MTTLLSLNRTPVVNKLLLHLFAALSLAMAGLPTLAHAASDGGDYVAVQVPDLTLAVTFFRDVMNCSVISDSGYTASATTSLMACGRETTVEITQASTHATPRAGASSQTFTLDIDDASAVAGWLRANHVQLVGSPTRLTNGQDAGKLAVTFLTPWGQPLRLVSRMKADDLLESSTTVSRVAVQ
ncbi:VOC family protein [Rhodanobacter sp. BL-MT-08]